MTCADVRVDVPALATMGAIVDREVRLFEFDREYRLALIGGAACVRAEGTECADGAAEPSLCDALDIGPCEGVS